MQGVCVGWGACCWGRVLWWQWPAWLVSSLVVASQWWSQGGRKHRVEQETWGSTTPMVTEQRAQRECAGRAGGPCPAAVAMTRINLSCSICLRGKPSPLFLAGAYDAQDTAAKYAPELGMQTVPSLNITYTEVSLGLRPCFSCSHACCRDKSCLALC